MAILNVDLNAGPLHFTYDFYCIVSTVEKIRVAIVISLPEIYRFRLKTQRKFVRLQTRDVYFFLVVGIYASEISVRCPPGPTLDIHYTKTTHLSSTSGKKIEDQEEGKKA